jgi:hypothetical protein
MTPQEALQIVAQACAEFRGTLKDHQMIQQALEVLAKTLATEPQTNPPPSD